jgi:HNH endonuclease
MKQKAALGPELCSELEMSRDDFLNRELAESLLIYDRSTGAFIWRIRDDVPAWWNTKYAGKIAGSITDEGYWIIVINKRLYLAHRLVWLFEKGVWPTFELDHKDCNKLHNQIDNLRPASGSMNCANGPKRKQNRSGYKGVHWCAKQKKFIAQICVNYKRIRLGASDDPKEAHALYIAAAEHHFKQFARFS